MRGGFVPGDVTVNEASGHRMMLVDAGLGYYWKTSDGVATVESGYARRLLVIDPEDREQVEALTERFFNERSRGDRDLIVGGNIDAMQAALRSLIADPKPEEPLGLGAVVEAANGDLWVRLDDSGVWACASDEDKAATYWPTIAAVKVLSEGVTP